LRDREAARRVIHERSLRALTLGVGLPLRDEIVVARSLGEHVGGILRTPVGVFLIDVELGFFKIERVLVRNRLLLARLVVDCVLALLALRVILAFEEAGGCAERGA